MVEELVEAMMAAKRRVHRVLFISHPAFVAGMAKVTVAGELTLVTATPDWWRLLIDMATDRAMIDLDPRLVEFKFRGMPILPLQAYHCDKDWPTIMEAIIRLKLIDETAVFR